MIKVLVVDDTATTRHLVIKLLTEGGQIEVIGQAHNGKEAVELARLLAPDVITMDVVMPVMDGVAATAQIMRQTPTPIVIMSSLDDIRRSPISMEALNNGALAILALPLVASKDLSACASHMRETVMAVAKVKSVRLEPSRQKQERPKLVPSQSDKSIITKSVKQLLNGRDAIEIICMASSVGGPAALAKILGELPADLPVPVLVTQHISQGFTDNLAVWLDHGSPMTVKVASDNETMIASTVYIAPDNCHLGVKNKTRINVSGGAPIKGFRPAANFMFESIARVFKKSSLAIILTGMGDDGLAGLRVQHDNGAIIIAQDEATSVVYGMPKAAVENNLADLVLPLDNIAPTLMQLVLGSQSEMDGGHLS
jgi:two-component system chemotaxis response regulator CheB